MATKQHPNLVKLNAAVTRWVEAGMGRMDGADALAKRADWVAEQIAILGAARTTPAHLEGLTVFELIEAQGMLEQASRTQAAKVAAMRAGQDHRVAA